MSLVCDSAYALSSDEDTLSDYDAIDDSLLDEPDYDSIPVGVARNRDFDDLAYMLCCRNCMHAVDAQGYCYCTTQENKTPDEKKPEKRKLNSVIDLTGKKTKVIDFCKNK